MSDDTILGISRGDRAGVDVVVVDGEVDLTNADDVQQAVEATTATSVVLDLTRVAYLDSSGIRAIDRGHRSLMAEERSLLIVSPPETAADWTLRVAGFDREIVMETIDAALLSAAARHASA
jgi:anti-sigma B factor antagonist